MDSERVVLIGLAWISVFVLCMFVLSNCTPMTEDERFDSEYEEAMELAQWRRCQAIYAAQGVATTSDHSHGRGTKHRRWDVRNDLMWNDCHWVLRGDR